MQAWRYSRWISPPETITTPPVKPGTGLLISLLVSLLVLICATVILHLSNTAEFSRVPGLKIKGY